MYSINVDLKLSSDIRYDYVSQNKLVLFDNTGLITEIEIDKGLVSG